MPTSFREKLQQPFSERVFLGLAAGLAFLTYVLVFRLSGNSTLAEAALASLRNFVPLAATTIAARVILRRYILPLSGLAQLSCHLLLGAVFALCWYWLLMIMLGLDNGEGLTRFQVRPVFHEPAFTWQMLQGVTVYAAVAAITMLRGQPGEAEVLSDAGFAEPAGERPNLERYLIRTGDDILPVDVDDIVSIEGADDYAEVVSRSGRHLLRATLRELEQSLDGERFLRVHRSRIVNLKRLVRAEPAGGGRFTLHMEMGTTVLTSRAGARAIRERML